MADRYNLRSLAPELLLLIFEHLPNLDEPPCLAMTCNPLYAVFEKYEDQIAWSIIVCSSTSNDDLCQTNSILNITKRASPHHKFDIRLCCLADALHGADEDITLQAPRALPSCLHFDLIFRATVESIGMMPSHLRRIRLWWKQAAQLRSNFISHLNKYLNAPSYQVTMDSTEEDYVVDCFLEACNADLDRQIDQHCLSPNRHEGETVSQERFYRAVIARTLEAKVIQILAINLESADEITMKSSEVINSVWVDCSKYTLRESLENLEIFDYTSNFLLQYLLNSLYTFQEWEQTVFNIMHHPPNVWQPVDVFPPTSSNISNTI